MKRLLSLAFVAALSVVFTAAAGANQRSHSVGAAYTIANAAAGNELVVYSRSSDGSLAYADSVPAGGTGTGAGLASQGAVTLTPDGRYVLAVSPGLNTVAAFTVDSRGARLLDTAPSGGNRPVSLTVSKNLVYVLNNDNAAPATVSGFTLGSAGLTPLAGSTRTLNAGATDAAQVKLSPDGATLVVTGRSSQRIDTFPVLADGRLGALGSFDPAPGGTPFGFDFDNKGHLLVSLAGVGSSSGAASYALGATGALATITPRSRRARAA